MDLPPCGRGALVVPPSAAGIAGSRPGAMFWICRSSHGGFQFSALRAECLFTRPSGALQMCRLRQRRLPGPAPAGGPTSCAPKKSAEEGRSRGLPPVPLRNPREYLASTRRLPSLPTGTPAEGSIQVAGAPNEGNGKCRRGRPEPNVLRGPGELFQKFPWKKLSCTPPGAGRRAGVAWLRASWSAGMSARKGEGSPGQSRTSSSLARVMPT